MGTRTIDTYVRGSVDPAGRGGWAALMVHGDHRKRLSGAGAASAAAAMELTACIEALLAAKPGFGVRFHIANANIRLAFTDGWVVRWAARGWRHPGGRPLDHADLWKRLSALVSNRPVEWVEPEASADMQICLALATRERLRCPLSEKAPAAQGEFDLEAVV